MKQMVLEKKSQHFIGTFFCLFSNKLCSPFPPLPPKIKPTTYFSFCILIHCWRSKTNKKMASLIFLFPSSGGENPPSHPLQVGRKEFCLHEHLLFHLHWHCLWQSVDWREEEGGLVTARDANTCALRSSLSSSTAIWTCHHRVPDGSHFSVTTDAVPYLKHFCAEK